METALLVKKDQKGKEHVIWIGEKIYLSEFKKSKIDNQGYRIELLWFESNRRIVNVNIDKIIV